MIPIITQHPRDQVVTAGGAAYFSCAYSAPAPAAASLAWFREGAALEGGGRGTLVLSGVTGAEAGRYYCRVTTGLGTVQSRHTTPPHQTSAHRAYPPPAGRPCCAWCSRSARPRSRTGP